jgi:hypothetical protein
MDYARAAVRKKYELWPKAGLRSKFCGGHLIRFEATLAIPSAFGAERRVMIDIAARISPDLRVSL